MSAECWPDWNAPSEKWLPVVGYEGEYEVSDQGRVKSVKKSQSFLLRPFRRKGYAFVNLYRPGSQYRTRKVHKLVLEAFVGPCPYGMQTRHLNSIRDDNRVGNLTWGTAQENADDRRRTGSLGPRFTAERWNR